MTVDRMTPPDHPEYHTRRIWDNVVMDPPAQRCNEPAVRSLPSLPSIHQTFPDFKQLVSLPGPPSDLRDRLPKTPPSATSPTGSHFPMTTPPEYVYSPDSFKRRRVSSDEEQEFYRASEVPRPYAPGYQDVPRQRTRSPESRTLSRPWVDSGPESPYCFDYSLPRRSPDSTSLFERAETRTVATTNSESYRIREYDDNEYMRKSSRRSSYAPSNGYAADTGGYEPRGREYRHHPYDYHHPSRGQSLSIGSARLDRTPFSHGEYGHPYMRVDNYGVGASGDGKTRKRRGNLPKDTTETLRAWFISHLGHPYPTEDEKQMLMRDTNLQMNQISNWFINARRRQLPNLINNARAEAKAKGRSGDGKGLPLSEHSDPKIGGTEGGAYGCTEAPERYQTTGLKRGSI